jgi:hypothetical protein
MNDLQISDHDGQQIVEIMGNAAGELADRLHLLSLHHPLARFLEQGFGAVPIGNVTRDLGETDVGAVRIVDTIQDDTRPDPAAVFPYAPALSLHSAFSRGSRQQFLRQPGGAILLGVEQAKVQAENLLRGIALDVLSAGVPTGNAPLPVDHVNRIVLDALNQHLELPLIVLRGFDHGRFLA